MINSYTDEKQIPSEDISKWPLPTLNHLQRLTDGCGIIQHAKFRCPDYATGYCTDDNSRALIAAIRYNHWDNDDDAQELMVRYLAFLRYAQHPDGRMHNFVSYARTYLDEVGSYDCLGQTVWALGEATTCDDDHIAHLAAEMLRQTLPHVTEGFPPHSLAYTLLGLYAYAQNPGYRKYSQLASQPLADALKEYYLRERSDEWEWFLPILTYANARLPQALLCGGQLLNDETLITAGLKTLDFLRSETIINGIFAPVGCHGWHRRAEARAQFDQQPIDTGSMVEACITAYKITHDSSYWDDATLAMSWFYGNNVHGLSLYDTQSGGCHDGLNPDGVNENLGAESTIVHLLAQLAVFTVLPRLNIPERKIKLHDIASGVRY